ncbi:MAG TPA: ECF transporter S component [Acidobacteriota bacterium]|nr:ECF transporter S component [Acidobacteriota bacterium]
MRLETRTLALIALGALVNIVGGQINQWLRLPIFLDSIGTILAAILGGPISGAITGLTGNLARALIAGPVEAAFAPVAIAIGVVAGLAARFGLFRRMWQAAVSGVLISLVLTLVAIPIQIYLFGGVTGAGSDLVLLYLVHIGRTLLSSVAWTILGSNIIDKVLSCLLAWLIVQRLPARLRASFPALKAGRA